MITILNDSTSRKGIFYLSFSFVIFLLTSSYCVSLYGKTFNIDGIETYNLALAVIPEPVRKTEIVPEKELTPKPLKKETSTPNADVRTKLIKPIESTPTIVPTEISSKPVDVPPVREGIKTVVGSENKDGVNAVSDDYKGKVIGGGQENTGLPSGTGTSDKGIETTPEPKKEVKEAPPEVLRTNTILNSKAVHLPKPPYSAAARQVRAQGQVKVMVSIDENGKVTSAKVESGHPLLRRDAENAARQARFSPAFINGKPVKVTGYITYNFVLQ